MLQPYNRHDRLKKKLSELFMSGWKQDAVEKIILIAILMILEKSSFTVESSVFFTSVRDIVLDKQET